MHADFRSRFIEYLTDGMPIKIADDETPIFYQELDKFINTADNDFESSYLKDSEVLSISDKFIDYLTVKYEDSKIVFRTTEHTSLPALLIDPETRQRMAEAFIGVLLFVEGISPSEDSKIIPEVYSDKWKVQFN